MMRKEALAEWAAARPRIKRLWLVNGRAAANGALDVQLELQPVLDSGTREPAPGEARTLLYERTS